MSTRRHLLLSTCQFLLTLPSLAQDQEEPKPEKRALLIGIDKYEDTNHISSLGGAAADAAALKQTLIKSMGFSDRSAVSIGGQVIKKSLGFSSQSFSVKPYYNPEISTDANVSKIYNHWKLMRDVLNDDHETNTLGLFGRGQLLS